MEKMVSLSDKRVESQGFAVSLDPTCFHLHKHNIHFPSRKGSCVLLKTLFL